MASALTDDEKGDLELAREQARRFAPILQAYIDIMLKGTDMANADGRAKNLFNKANVRYVCPRFIC